MNCLTIKELHSNDEIREAFPVMKQLLNQLNDSTYLQLVKEALEKTASIYSHYEMAKTLWR